MAPPPIPVNIVWLKTGPLHPLDTGGKIRTYHMLRELMKKHRVTYLALCDDRTDDGIKRQAAEYSHDQIWIPWHETPKRSVRFLVEVASNLIASRLPYVIQKYRSPEMTAAAGLMVSEAGCDILICDFLTPAINVAGLLKPKGVKTLLFQHNVESQIWRRLRDTAHGCIKRAYFNGQWRRMERFEHDAASWFDGVVGVSDDDCRIMREQLGLGNILGSVPTGVDTDFFQSHKSEKKPGSIIFLGSMDWMPNIDAVEYFVEAIFPRIKQKTPEATFTIVGRNPPGRVRVLAAQDPSVCVTGTVDDVRPYIASAAAVVVPLRAGGGTRIKIFEAMAAGAPVVSTSIGAEGLPVLHGRHILLADEPEDFASCVARLLREPSLRGEIGGNGLELVRSRFSWESVAKVFENYLQKLLTSPA